MAGEGANWFYFSKIFYAIRFCEYLLKHLLKTEDLCSMRYLANR